MDSEEESPAVPQIYRNTNFHKKKCIYRREIWGSSIHTVCAGLAWLGLCFLHFLSQQGYLYEGVYLTDDVLVFKVKIAAGNHFSPPYYRSITTNKGQLVHLISNNLTRYLKQLKPAQHDRKLQQTSDSTNMDVGEKLNFKPQTYSWNYALLSGNLPTGVSFATQTCLRENPLWICGL